MPRSFLNQKYTVVRQGKFNLACKILGHKWKFLPFGKFQVEALCLRCGRLERALS